MSNVLTTIAWNPAASVPEFERALYERLPDIALSLERHGKTFLLPDEARTLFSIPGVAATDAHASPIRVISLAQALRDGYYAALFGSGPPPADDTRPRVGHGPRVRHRPSNAS